MALVADLRGLKRAELRQRLGELLREEGAAPLGAIPGPSYGRDSMLDEVAVSLPVPGPETPATPTCPKSLSPPPDEFEGRATHPVRGATLAAAVYGKYFTPCILAINERRGGQTRRIERKLSDVLELDDSHLVICDGGRGLVAWVSGMTPDPEHAGARGGAWEGLFWLRSPDWQPELIREATTEELMAGWEPFRVAGQSAGGDRVYVREVTTTQEGRRAALWQLDGQTGKLKKLPGEQWPDMGWSVSSADGQMLAEVGGGIGREPFPGVQAPVQVVDTRDGASHVVTWRGEPGGRWADCFVGWSADDPHRLYFVDSSVRLWRLNLDLTVEAPQWVLDALDEEPVVGMSGAM